MPYPYKVEVSDGRIFLAVEFEEAVGYMNILSDRGLATKLYGGIFTDNNAVGDVFGENTDIFPPVIIMMQEPELGNFDEFTGLRKVV